MPSTAAKFKLRGKTLFVSEDNKDVSPVYIAYLKCATVKEEV